MATIAGQLDCLNTTCSATLSTPPLAIVSAIHSGKPKFWSTDADGDYSFTLDQGHYTIRIPHTPAFWILVPAGSASYSLDDLYDNQGAEMIQPDETFDDLTEFMSSDSTAQIVWIGALGSGEDQGEGMFRRGGSGTHDGVNLIVRTDGIYYTRIQTT